MDMVRVGIACFVWKDGKFLVGQRRGSHGEGTWSVPGGHLEFGETWEECAAREVLEETGLHITNTRFLAATQDFFPADHKQYTTIWIESDWLAGEPIITEPDKWVNQQWHTFQDLPEPLFLPWQQLRKAKPELFPS